MKNYYITTTKMKEITVLNCKDEEEAIKIAGLKENEVLMIATFTKI